MTIHFATDHAGFALKNTLLSYVRDELGHDVVDHGAEIFDQEDDYPLFISEAAHAVAQDQNSLGIVLGGSGQGEAMCANKVPGIRAALYYGGDEGILTLSREHNNANILSLGARFVDVDQAKHAVKLWLTTPFSGEERHTRRLAQY